jgi:hypothetical protein
VDRATLDFKWRSLPASIGALLAREPVGCAEVALLAEGFSVGQLAALVMDGFAKRRPIVTNVGGQEKIVLWMQITDAGRAALAD